MVKLLDSEVRTREVVAWQGLHLFHAPLSSCSQKVRIFLAEKGVAWQPHPVNLAVNENVSDYFLGINPRGLVPVLVDDGAVHVESNDIILHIEERFPEPRLIPAQGRANAAAMLAQEDALHVDIRNITFRFLFEPPVAPKSPEVLARYRRYGAATVGGTADTHKAEEIAYWERYADHRVRDDDVRASVAAFASAFSELDGRLAGQDYLLGHNLSVVDIAWFVYANRLLIAGYPLARHAALHRWYERLLARPGWADEVALPELLRPMVAGHQARLAQDRRRLVDVCDVAAAEPGA